MSLLAKFKSQQACVNHPQIFGGGEVLLAYEIQKPTTPDKVDGWETLVLIWTLFRVKSLCKCYKGYF